MDELAARTGVAGLRTIFGWLAAEEQKHYDTIRAMKKGAAWSMTDTTVLERAKNVFEEVVKDQSLPGSLKEDLDGYKHAMKIEADSVRLYEDMATRESEEERVRLLLKIANEEKQHYNIMENLYDFVLRPKYYLEWREFSNLGNYDTWRCKQNTLDMATLCGSPTICRTWFLKTGGCLTQ